MPETMETEKAGELLAPVEAEPIGAGRRRPS
jgi:hypothetical protein